MLSQRLGVLFLSATLLTQTSCYKATFQADPSAPASSRGPEHVEWSHFFLFGLIGEKQLDVSQVCGGAGVAEVQTRMSFVNGLVGGLTLGLYAPRSVKVVCASGSATRELQLHAKADGTPVRAELHEADRVVELQIEAQGEDAWLFTPKG
jgi:hypothetical protein